MNHDLGRRKDDAYHDGRDSGTTINQYVTSKRLVHAKQLLIEGYSAADAAELCGFGDYSNFFRAFTKATNISPQKYVQFITRRELTEGCENSGTIE